MILVHSSTVAAILCQLSTTSNPKSVWGMFYTVLDATGLKSYYGTIYKYLPITAMLNVICHIRCDRVKIPLRYKIINGCQPWPSLQGIHHNKHQSTTANHRPGKPDTVYQHARQSQTGHPNMQGADKLSQHAYPKFIVYKGLQKARTVDKQRQWNSCRCQNWQSNDNSIIGS